MRIIPLDGRRLMLMLIRHLKCVARRGPESKDRLAWFAAKKEWPLHELHQLPSFITRSAIASIYHSLCARTYCAILYSGTRPNITHMNCMRPKRIPSHENLSIFIIRINTKANVINIMPTRTRHSLNSNAPAKTKGKKKKKINDKTAKNKARRKTFVSHPNNFN